MSALPKLEPLLLTLFWRRSVWKPRSLLLLLLVGVDVLGAVFSGQVAPFGYRSAYDQLAADAVFGFLLPFSALQVGTAVVRDEVESGTIGYLLMRPLTRGSILLSRFLGGVGVVMGLTTLALVLNALVMGQAPIGELPRVLAAALLGAAAYTAVFCALGVVLKRPFVVGVLFLLFFELPVSRLPMVARAITIRSNVENLAGVAPETKTLGILMDVQVAPMTSFLVVTGVLAVAMALAVAVFERKEYTPDASA